MKLILHPFIGHSRQLSFFLQLVRFWLFPPISALKSTGYKSGAGQFRQNIHHKLFLMDLYPYKSSNCYALIKTLES